MANPKIEPYDQSKDFFLSNGRLKPGFITKNIRGKQARGSLSKGWKI
jgi:hypothetical protein